jgi:hypothetical protein
VLNLKSLVLNRSKIRNVPMATFHDLNNLSMSDDASLRVALDLFLLNHQETFNIYEKLGPGKGLFLQKVFLFLQQNLAKPDYDGS